MLRHWPNSTQQMVGPSFLENFMSLTLSSPDFAHEGPIPTRFTCDGEKISPALAWSGAPEGTRSFALIMQDPDAPDPAAPERTFIHWVLHDLPPTTRSLPVGVKSDDLPEGSREGVNDSEHTGWTSPCPPIGRHRYYFRLFALDRMLGDIGTPTASDLERAMISHILATTELMGTYERPSQA